jgi:hypothetical protein
MRLILSLMLVIGFISCKSKVEGPDVSAIKMDLTTQRFEKELFSLDTSNLAPQLDKLLAKYPAFGENFITTILNTDPRWSPDTMLNYVKGFISSYRNVYDTSLKVFPDFSKYENEIETALKHVSYYFPSYKIPRKIITYIGPLDGYGDILDEDVIIVGLHHHLGKSFSLYQSPWMQETYPAYITSRFEPDRITVNTIRNIVTDIFPEATEDKSLLIQMVEKGKRLWLMSKILPGEDEYKIIGYSSKQMKESYEHERSIWDLFVQNNLLQSLDYNIIKNYVGDSPKTQELGEASPGNIGSFSGWQIVKLYVSKHPDITPKQLMATDPEKLYTDSKYKP